VCDLKAQLQDPQLSRHLLHLQEQQQADDSAVIACIIHACDMRAAGEWMAALLTLGPGRLRMAVYCCIAILAEQLYGNSCFVKQLGQSRGEHSHQIKL
jgi:hypothetical protein